MILDTCALLWLAQSTDRLSKTARDSINEAASVGISAITAFEIGQKYQKGKLKLPQDPVIWLDQVLKHHSLEVFDVTVTISLLATELPPIHNDPFDRLIIATAKVYSMPLVTTDSIFKNYGLSVIE